MSDDEKKPKAPDKFLMDKDSIVWTKPPESVKKRAEIARVRKYLAKLKLKKLTK